MKKIFVALLLGLFSVPAFAAGMASVDIEKVYISYSLVKQANSYVNVAEAGLKNVVAAAEEELNTMQSSGASAKKLEAKEAAVQKSVDAMVLKLYKDRKAYNDKINANVNKALADLAKEKNYDLILNKFYVVDGTPDVTTEFLAHLEKLSKNVKL